MDHAVARDKIIPYPNSSDILMGRSKRRPGNKKYADIISACTKRYKGASERLDKTIVAMELMETIQARGSRFLQRENDGWTEISQNRPPQGKQNSILLGQHPATDESGRGDSCPIQSTSSERAIALVSNA